MTSIRMALLQMTSCGQDQERNVAKGEIFCRRASQMGADIALFPEMWNTGYGFFDPSESGSHEAWKSQAVSRDSAFVRHFRELARALKMAIALTYLEAWNGSPRNSLSLIDRRGRILMTYAKVHTCDFDQEAALTPGDGFHVCTLETETGETKIGAMICFDREFPESARILMLMGAKVILIPNACTMDAHRLGQLRARAFENMIGIALTNYAAPQENGNSVAYDGIAYEELAGPRDMLIVETGEQEGVVLAEFDLDALRAYRKSEVWGNAFRKPQHYGLLTSAAVTQPFFRQMARK